MLMLTWTAVSVPLVSGTKAPAVVAEIGRAGVIMGFPFWVPTACTDITQGVPAASPVKVWLVEVMLAEAIPSGRSMLTR